MAVDQLWLFGAAVLFLNELTTDKSLYCSQHQAKTTSQIQSINGWTPDANQFAYGLPGSIAPIADFDPLGFAASASLEKMKGYREAELQHGRGTFHLFF